MLNVEELDGSRGRGFWACWHGAESARVVGVLWSYFSVFVSWTLSQVVPEARRCNFIKPENDIVLQLASKAHIRGTDTSTTSNYKRT
jgi:hypothetical protein